MLGYCSSKNPRVAESLIYRPRHHHGHVRPSRRRRCAFPRFVRQSVRNHERHRAIVFLVQRHVSQPLGVKPRRIEIERRGRRKHLRVPGPPQPLVALRAICRHIQKIPFLSPDDVVLQLVQQRVRAFKCPGPFHRRMHDDSGKIFRLHFARPSAHRDIPESLKCKMRLKRFRSCASARVANSFFRGAQIGGIEISFFVQHLRVPQCHGRSRRRR